MNMKYLLIILASLYLSQYGLTATLESQDRFPDETRFSFNNETSIQVNRMFEDQLPNNADCDCKNGKCLEEDGKVVCKCNPGFGNYTKTYCKACKCGPDSNCMWVPTVWFSSKKYVYANQDIKKRMKSA
ncbi:hypothetical protein HNY73_014461 [Argiope bruennichi]|uniref:EGF-like domain-containing protein n=1 Tax=Argiope bruennichi TaxID=94029 RepID=A0A8T0EP10_ARGBR|nr:hypothetical protein HNY73_014461 [Argiope bruennichi]